MLEIRIMAKVLKVKGLREIRMYYEYLGIYGLLCVLDSQN